MATMEKVYFDGYFWGLDNATFFIESVAYSLLTHDKKKKIWNHMKDDLYYLIFLSFSDSGLSSHAELLSHLSYPIFQEQLAWSQSRSRHVYRYDSNTHMGKSRGFIVINYLLYCCVLSIPKNNTHEGETSGLIIWCVSVSVLSGFLLGNLPEEHFSHLNMGSITKGETLHTRCVF